MRSRKNVLRCSSEDSCAVPIPGPPLVTKVRGHPRSPQPRVLSAAVFGPAAALPDLRITGSQLVVPRTSPSKIWQKIIGKIWQDVNTSRRKKKKQDVSRFAEMLAPRLRRRMNNELNFSPNFERLVLGCIDADVCK